MSRAPVPQTRKPGSSAWLCAIGVAAALPVACSLATDLDGLSSGGSSGDLVGGSGGQGGSGGTHGTSTATGSAGASGGGGSEACAPLSAACDPQSGIPCCDGDCVDARCCLAKGADCTAAPEACCFGCSGSGACCGAEGCSCVNEGNQCDGTVACCAPY